MQFILFCMLGRCEALLVWQVVVSRLINPIVKGKVRSVYFCKKEWKDVQSLSVFSFLFFQWFNFLYKGSATLTEGEVCRSPVGHPSAHWSHLLWRAFGLSSESLWHQEWDCQGVLRRVTWGRFLKKPCDCRAPQHSHAGQTRPSYFHVTQLTPKVKNSQGVKLFGKIY